jgi:hypothetical protein
VIFGIVTSPIVFGSPGVSLRSNANSTVKTPGGQEEGMIYHFYSNTKSGFTKEENPNNTGVKNGSGTAHGQHHIKADINHPPLSSD